MLLIFSYGLYLAFIGFGANDTIASSLLSWAATSFATLTLIFTFKTWREQKASDTLSVLCKEYYLILNTLNKEIKNFYHEFSGNFPIIEIDIPLMKYFLEINEKLEDLEGKLHIIFNYSKNGILLDEINKINSLIELNMEVRNAVVSKESSQMEHFNLVIEKINNFEKKFKLFKTNVDKILIAFTFYEEKSVRP